MALRFLADHCISNTIIQSLRDAGHEVVRLMEVLPVESPDATVIAKAQEIEAIVLSLNGDFADIVTYPPKNYKGIVSLANWYGVKVRTQCHIVTPKQNDNSPATCSNLVGFVSQEF